MEHITDNNPETIAVAMSNAEARNALQGLELLHGKCVDNLQSISPLELQGGDLKKYFRAKQEEIAAQISVLRKAITGKPLHHVTGK